MSEEEGLPLPLADKDDGAEFGAGYAEIQRPLHVYLLRLTGSLEEAEDLAQEAVLRVFRLWREGELHSDWGASRRLLFTIAHNLAIDRIREQKRLLPKVDRTVVQRPTSSDALLWQEVDKALRQLPENHRQAFLLRVERGLGYAEIAEVMDVSVDAVKVWLHRARRRLTELLDKDGQYVGCPSGEKSYR